MLKEAQKNAKNMLKALQSEGYVISKYTIDMINKDITKKTQKEAAVYLKRMNMRYIKSRAINKPSSKNTSTVYVNPKYLIQNPIVDTAYSGRAAQLTGNQPVSIRKSKNGFADDVYNMILTGAQSYGRSTDVKKKIQFIYKRLGLEEPEDNTFVEDIKNLETDLKNALRKTDRDSFINSMAFQQYLAEGVYDPRRVANRKELSTLSSKQGFRQHYQLFTPDRVESIYDFFQNSQVWQEIRKRYKPSDEPDIDNFLDDLSSALESGAVTVKDIDRALMNYGQTKSLTQTLNDAIAYAKERH